MEKSRKSLRTITGETYLGALFKNIYKNLLKNFFVQFEKYFVKILLKIPYNRNPDFRSITDILGGRFTNILGKIENLKILKTLWNEFGK